MTSFEVGLTEIAPLGTRMGEMPLASKENARVAVFSRERGVPEAGEKACAEPPRIARVPRTEQALLQTREPPERR